MADSFKTARGAKLTRTELFFSQIIHNDRRHGEHYCHFPVHDVTNAAGYPASAVAFRVDDLYLQTRAVQQLSHKHTGKLYIQSFMCMIIHWSVFSVLVYRIHVLHAHVDVHACKQYSFSPNQ